MVGVHRERRVDRAAVGKFRIVSQLGQGGTADVYLALADGPAGFRKLVVLKVLRKNLNSDDDFRAMFLSEARLAARLHHPNIVQTNEVLELDGTPVIVMEYLEGQPLSQVIVRGRDAGFTQAMQIRVLADALHGLHAAHELVDFDGTPLGVVHRDVSPQNIFVTLAGYAKVLDFGIAKLERSLVETEVGTIKGKVRYMAPEQIAGERLTRRADVYSAGVILWEALVGERMWKGCSESEIRACVLQGDLPMPERLRADVPPSLARICRRALSLSPDQRHASALEVADDLEAALPALGPLPTHRQIGALVATLFEDVHAETKNALESVSRSDLVVNAAAAPTDSEVDSLDQPGAPGRRRPIRRGVWMAVTGVAALAVGLAFFATTRNSARPGPPATPAGSPSGTQKIAPASAAPGSHPMVQPGTASATAADDSAGRAHPRSPGAGRSVSKRPPRPMVPSETGASRSTATEHDCEHPFFFDANGIKKFRSECM